MAGAAGVLGGLAAGTLLEAAPAQAAQGSPVLEGQDNTGATARTAVFTTGNNEWGMLADPNSSGLGSLGVYGHGQDIGVLGEAGGNNGTGVSGTGTGNGDGVSGSTSGLGNGVSGIGASGAGVFGASNTGLGVEGHGSPGVRGTGSGGGNGVEGFASGTSGVGVAGTGAGGSAGVTGVGGATGPGVYGDGTTGVIGAGTTGVQGLGSGSAGIGVQGIGSGTGHGVRGTAAAAGGAGVFAENTGGGAALQATGPFVFSRSGVATVPAGKATATVTGVALTSASLVLATLQQFASGVSVLAAVPNVAGKSFTVHLSKSVAASAKVAWFVVN